MLRHLIPDVYRSICLWKMYAIARPKYRFIYFITKYIAVLCNSLLFLYTILVMCYANDTKLIACIGTVWYLYLYTELNPSFQRSFFHNEHPNNRKIIDLNKLSFPQIPIVTYNHGILKANRETLCRYDLDWICFALMNWKRTLYYSHHCIPGVKIITLTVELLMTNSNKW